MNLIRKYKEETEPLFRKVEAIRIPLAKHEIAGKEKLLAEAPGLGGVNKMTGSMYWRIVLSEREVTIIERRTLADRFLNVLSWFEEEEAALLLAKEQSVCAMNKGQRAKVTAAVETTKKTAPRPLDEILRTKGRGGRRNKHRAGEKNSKEPVLAPKGEWPLKDSLMIVPVSPKK